jgi:hypothetical protein
MFTPSIGLTAENGVFWSAKKISKKTQYSVTHTRTQIKSGLSLEEILSKRKSIVYLKKKVEKNKKLKERFEKDKERNKLSILSFKYFACQNKK